MGDILQILQGRGRADSGRHVEGLPGRPRSHMPQAPVAAHCLFSMESGSWTCPTRNSLFSLLKASVSSLVKPVLLPIQALSECKASTSDNLPYLGVPDGLLKGSDMALHPTWTSGQGLDRGSANRQTPTAIVNSPWVGTCDTFGFKEPEKVTGWPSWSSELGGVGVGVGEGD